MRRIGHNAAPAALVTHLARRRVVAVAPAIGLLGLAIGASAFAIRRGPGPEPVDLAGVARSTVQRALPLFEVPERAEPDRMLGTFKLSYYWMPEESGRSTVPLYTKRCRRIAKVSSSFSQKLRMEGGGKLRDGRVLIYAGRCSCGHSPCYKVASRDHEWGTGVDDRPLAPFRSVAVDPDRVPIGTVMYVPELDGITMPGNHSYGGFVHDGCVVADDRGGGVRGRQIDLFAARHTHYTALDRRHRLKKVTVFRGGERCRALERRVASRRGDG